MLFHVFASQEERRAFGGSYFIEMQFCDLPRGYKEKELVAVANIEHWKNDSLYINDDEVFRGFIKDEFKRLHPVCEIEERLNKVFDYRNMSLTPANFTEEQARIFAEEIENYKEENKENIALWERYEQLKEVF